MAKVVVTKTQNEYRLLKEKEKVIQKPKIELEPVEPIPANTKLEMWTVTMTKDIRSDSLVYVKGQKSAIKSEKILVKWTTQVRAWVEDDECEIPLSVIFKVKDQEIRVTGAIIRDKDQGIITKITSNFEGFIYPEKNGANVVFVATQNKPYDPTPRPEVM